MWVQVDAPKRNLRINNSHGCYLKTGISQAKKQDFVSLPGGFPCTVIESESLFFFLNIQMHICRKPRLTHTVSAHGTHSTPTHCSTQQHNTCNFSLQHTVTHCSTLRCKLQHTATHFTATYSNMLPANNTPPRNTQQRTPPQHTATHRNILHSDSWPPANLSIVASESFFRLLKEKLFSLHVTVVI